MKVIFLDIDGVLNCATTTKRLECCNEFTFVDTRKILRLRDIVERTGAQIVLSSTWRLGADPKAFFLERAGYDELRREFLRVHCPVWVDITPDFPRAKRWQEINAWLMLHPEVEEFVVLDDVGEELKPLADHLVLTNMRDGLTKERAELAIKMLGEKKDV